MPRPKTTRNLPAAEQRWDYWLIAMRENAYHWELWDISARACWKEHTVGSGLVLGDLGEG